MQFWKKTRVWIFKIRFYTAANFGGHGHRRPYSLGELLRKKTFTADWDLVLEDTSNKCIPKLSLASLLPEISKNEQHNIVYKYVILFYRPLPFLLSWIITKFLIPVVQSFWRRKYSGNIFETDYVMLVKGYSQIDSIVLGSKVCLA